jgi:sugar O-acyltransferase (sialic acid O-acetyltransferase NeuD family)
MPHPTARPLLVVGAGGFARETADAVRALDGVFTLRGLLDDDPALHGRVVGGAPVLGPLAAVADHPDAAVVVCVGRPDAYTARRAIVARLDLPADRYATVVHPAASVGSTCTIGPGSVVLAHVTLTADVTVGAHVAVMPQVVLTHDVVVGDHATLASGVRLGGGVEIGTGAYVASGVLVREGRRIGPWAMVGMGSLVTRDVPAERLWFGTPARDVRRAPLPWPADDPLPEQSLDGTADPTADPTGRSPQLLPTSS